MTQQEIESIMDNTKFAELNLTDWLKMVLAKVNEWRSNL